MDTLKSIITISLITLNFVDSPKAQPVLCSVANLASIYALVCQEKLYQIIIEST